MFSKGTSWYCYRHSKIINFQKGLPQVIPQWLSKSGITSWVHLPLIKLFSKRHPDKNARDFKSYSRLETYTFSRKWASKASPSQWIHKSSIHSPCSFSWNFPSGKWFDNTYILPFPMLHQATHFLTTIKILLRFFFCLALSKYKANCLIHPFHYCRKSPSLGLLYACSGKNDTLYGASECVLNFLCIWLCWTIRASPEKLVHTN